MSSNYMQPSPQFPTPSGQAFTDFLQALFTSISGLPGDLVRPDWQPAPPKQPDITVNWLSLALGKNKADANAYVGLAPNNPGPPVNVTQRMEELTVRARFYGPQSMDYMGLTRDGFEIPFNLLALTQAKMGFVSTDEGMRVPDLVNERWCDSWVMHFVLRRQILRSYPILTFLSVSGSVSAELDSGNTKTVGFQSNL